MIIKLRANIDRTRTIVIYVDGPCAPSVARESGIVLAREKVDADGTMTWRLAVKGEPRAPSDVVAVYEKIPFDVAVEANA